MTTIFPICAMCGHRTTGLTCAAYPEGIPEPIFRGREDHTIAYFGDHGIQFELADDVTPEQFRWLFPRSRAVKSGRI